MINDKLMKIVSAEKVEEDSQSEEQYSSNVSSVESFSKSSDQLSESEIQKIIDE